MPVLTHSKQASTYVPPEVKDTMLAIHHEVTI